MATWLAARLSSFSKATTYVGTTDRLWRKAAVGKQAKQNGGRYLAGLLTAPMNATPAPGTLGVLMAMGPGFCLEMILLKW
jgi:hypothetical protein